MIDSNIFIIIALAFQVFGALMLALMSFRGLKIEVSDSVFVNDKPVTHVSMSAGYLNVGRFGLLFTLIGIILASIAALQN